MTSPPSRRRGLKQSQLSDNGFAWRSPPSRRRGLKLVSLRRWCPDVRVASLAEAWIETTSWGKDIQAKLSPPSRRRGLKHMIARVLGVQYLSPPSRRRGLKP